MKKFFIFVVLVGVVGYGVFYWRAHRYDEAAVIAPVTVGTATAYFAGGCFWCTEADFEKLVGVTEVVSGYSGGTTDNPTYTLVSGHATGHLESVEVRYDPKTVSYQQLVEYFFAHIDPIDPNGQFVDQGESYRSAVFYQNGEEKQIIENEIARLDKSGAYDSKIVTLVLPFKKLWPAEAYHQDYWKKNSVRYTFYRSNSGRDQYRDVICRVRKDHEVPCLSLPLQKDN